LAQQKLRVKNMKSKGAIRIVKKPSDLPSGGAKESDSSALSRQGARDMAETVSSWVSEFQQRRDDEGVRMLRSLFPAQ